MVQAKETLYNYNNCETEKKKSYLVVGLHFFNTIKDITLTECMVLTHQQGSARAGAAGPNFSFLILDDTYSLLGLESLSQH